MAVTTFLIGIVSLAASELVAQQPGASCVVNLGAKQYFGSAEQVKELQRLATTRSAAACPRAGFRFSAAPRRSLVLFDRTTGSVVRVAVWQGESDPKWEYWSGVTEERLRADDPDDGFDAGQYHGGGDARGLVPAATRRAVRALTGW